MYEPGLELGGPVVTGQKLARIVDIYGEELEAIAAPYDGLLIFLRTLPLVNAGDWVAGIGKHVRIIENQG